LIKKIVLKSGETRWEARWRDGEGDHRRRFRTKEEAETAIQFGRDRLQQRKAVPSEDRALPLRAVVPTSTQAEAALQFGRDRLRRRKAVPSEDRALPLRTVVPLYIAAIAGAEASIAFASVSLGVVIDAVVVLAALNRYLLAERAAGASETGRLRSHDVLLALPLVPIARISDLTMTVKGVPLLVEYALVGLPVLVATAWVAKLVGPRRVLCRISAWSWQQAGIGLCGVPLGLLAFLIFRPHPLGHPSVAQIIWGSLIVVVFVGFLEEVIFRGLLQDALTDLYGRSGIAWGSLLFAVAYLGVHPATFVLFAAALGLAFGWVVERTASLVGVILAHSLLAIGLILVWPRVLG
jgi:membrane protease YdiL (CAAX protease family)